MNGYLIAVMGTVLLCAILTSIIPNGKTAGVVKGMAKLACLLAIVSPIPKFLSGEKSWDKNLEKSVLQTDETFIQYYSNMRITQAEESLRQELHDKFAVRVAVTVRAKTDTTVLEFETISIEMENDVAEEVKTAMCEYLTKMYCSEVLIE